MARARIADAVGIAAVRTLQRDRETTALAVRYTLQLLAEVAEGNTVEVRVPPFGAVQCIEGPRPAPAAGSVRRSDRKSVV